MKINFFEICFIDSLDELHHEVGDEGPCPQAKPQQGHHQTSRSLRLLAPDHLGARDHADGANIAIGETEEQHDDDVGNITLESNESEASLGRPDVAEKEEGDENKPCDGEEKGDEAANLARFGPLDEASEEPAEIITNIEEKEAGNWDVECAGPEGVLGEGGLDLQGDGGEAAEGDQEADEDCCTIGRDLEHDTDRVDLDGDTWARVTIG